MDEIETNVLYYGDNLEILRKYIPDNSVDLIYLDPPFNSKATYNVLFREPTGKPSQAQISAFEDTWHWGLESERALQEIAASTIAPAPAKEFMSVLPELVGKRTDMAAYLTMMCIRLVELKRVLRDTGSIYLHCDPTASHYLKILMDTIFGVKNFRNEIIWHYGGRGAKAISSQFSRNSDTILFYTKSDEATFYKQYQVEKIPVAEAEKEGLRKDEEGRWFKTAPRGDYTDESIKRLESEGRIHRTRAGNIRIKYFLKEQSGYIIENKLVGNVWNDIADMMHAPAGEYLGYETQKRLPLLERIINASSNEGDIVLDPFCGCGTAIVAAQGLNRKWVGIDITYLAVGLMEWRLKNMAPMPVYKVIGEPEDLASAVDLANKDKYQFQWWAVAKVSGQPYGDKKKGADTGIDGYIYYMDERDKIKKAIVSVKGGRNVDVSMIRDLGHVIDREKSDIGVFIMLDKPTRPMIVEAAKKKFYHSPLGKDYPRIQIITIEEIFQGKLPEIPPWIAPIAKPTRVKKAEGKQLSME